MEIVVHGRNVVVPEHYRQHVAEKLTRLERYDHKIIRVDVELQHERNPRQTGSCQHIEITCRTRGPAVRAEACAEDFYKALDMAAEKLDRRFRHAADRRRVHHGRRTPPSLGVLPADVDPLATDVAAAVASAEEAATGEEVEDGQAEGPGQVVRVKEHPAKPMTVDQALFEMELVGHDFFLFSDVDTGRPSVVYRRHAYDYGLLRLGETTD
ncbi:MAG: ribosome hibernation-promoting factor, HPF/YfiA family [Jatrophihabitans sp.]|uniref:ribosome hibernation-promoting factor, HPF/YfiA family n=1 Tax=Jatrophihabitans sp. TaxID=1932789 RepID=UPI003F806A4C